MELELSSIMQPVPVKKHNLNKLQQWLNYELSGSVIFMLQFFGFVVVPLGLAILGIIIFMPLLIKVLLEQNRYGWLISFFILILSPPVFIYIGVEGWYWFTISLFFSVACFYIYCAALRLVIPEWID